MFGGGEAEIQKSGWFAVIESGLRLSLRVGESPLEYRETQ